MAKKVVEQMEAAVEGGGTDVLVEVVGDDDGKLFGDAAAAVEAA